jgi:hypothetical protein
MDQFHMAGTQRLLRTQGIILLSTDEYYVMQHVRDLFTCIINYLHVICMTFKLWICILCITLMMLIYVYYGLFICINLVDVMSLFSMVFSFQMPNFLDNSVNFLH